MFAAASGARLAHRHNKTAQKQIGLDQKPIVDGNQVRTKGLPSRHQQLKYSDVHGFRYNTVGQQRRLAYSSKSYTSNYNPGYKLSTSYNDINGRISKLGQFDFETHSCCIDSFYSCG
ncbi:hypothetical protein RUM43_004835 [Polyplax serrata]|uniref:Uncharacterized protein n=1 Tax=Polyplax serrata TaxID=468196 RepID=A0AAN8XMJ7_POLSC